MFVAMASSPSLDEGHARYRDFDYESAGAIFAKIASDAQRSTQERASAAMWEAIAHAQLGDVAGMDRALALASTLDAASTLPEQAPPVVRAAWQRLTAQSAPKAAPTPVPASAPAPTATPTPTAPAEAAFN